MEENFEKITWAEATVKSLESQNKHEDLENRLRWSYLRIVGSETEKLKQFIAYFLMEALGEIFTSPPPIDRPATRVRIPKAEAFHCVLPQLLLQGKNIKVGNETPTEILQCD